jgi:hypothetical protein
MNNVTFDFRSAGRSKLHNETSHEQRTPVPSDRTLDDRWNDRASLYYNIDAKNLPTKERKYFGRYL